MAVRATTRAVQRSDVLVQGIDKVCVFWLQGKCNRNPCRFMHRDSPKPNIVHRPDPSTKSPNVSKTFGGQNTHESTLLDESTLRAILLKKRQLMIASNDPSSGESNINFLSLSTEESSSSTLTEESVSGTSLKKLEEIEEGEIAESSSSDVERIQLLSTHESTGGETVTPTNQNKRVGDDGFTMLARLEAGPNKGIVGIALPSESDKLYSCTIDGTAQVWDCHTGQCSSTQQLGNPVGSSICEGTLVFIGTLHAVLAWNSRSNTSFHLYGSSGQVHAMFFKNDTLFAGDENGVILAWKHTSSEGTPFQPSTSYRGHTSRVTCLTADENTLYSGSADHTIRAWNLQTSMCVTLIGHTDAVTSLVCWNGTVLSGSLDKTVRAWAYGQHNLEVVYTHKEEHGVIALSVMHDAQQKSILLCSCDDSAVRLYDLPSFNQRGRMFARAPVSVIHNLMGAAGLVFTGDSSGALNVWRWVETP